MSAKKPAPDRAGLISAVGRATGWKPKEQRELPEAPAAKPLSRRGKSGLLTQHDPAVIQQLKVIAAQESTTQQKLVAEALNMVFAKYGKPQIA
jgi:Antitoxin-like ribbon-helix-helix